MQPVATYSAFVMLCSIDIPLYNHAVTFFTQMHFVVSKSKYNFTFICFYWRWFIVNILHNIEKFSTYFNQEVSTSWKVYPVKIITHSQRSETPDYLFNPAEPANISIQQDQVELREKLVVAENLCIPSDSS